MTTKPSEIFEGDNSSLKKTFDEATKPSGERSVEETVEEFKSKIYSNELTSDVEYLESKYEPDPEKIADWLRQALTQAIEGERRKEIDYTKVGSAPLLPKLRRSINADACIIKEQDYITEEDTLNSATMTPKPNEDRSVGAILEALPRRIDGDGMRWFSKEDVLLAIEGERERVVELAKLVRLQHTDYGNSYSKARCEGHNEGIDELIDSIEYNKGKADGDIHRAYLDFSNGDCSNEELQRTIRKNKSPKHTLEALNDK